MAEGYNHFDFVVIGSGYAGSILALILAKHNRSVLLVDKSSHPRFAIGESSTPIADALLATLAAEHSIPELRSLAAYGSWKATYPNLRCGLKRGFSYFCHEASAPFDVKRQLEMSCLVAASTADKFSDTHWVRSDIDQFLFSLASEYGVQSLLQSSVMTAERNTKEWKLTIQQKGVQHPYGICCKWIVDASGHGSFSRERLGAGSQDELLKTRARSIFGHFHSLGQMRDAIESKSGTTSNWNFDADSSAQHHVISDGWIWMLRFDNDLASVGLMTQDFTTSLSSQWIRVLANYPTIKHLLHNAILVDSTINETRPIQQMFLHEQQLARLNRSAIGDGWVALPNAFGFIDPLHSTGIAHNLMGVRRLANIFTSMKPHLLSRELTRYQAKLDAETLWIDELVSLCYAGLPNPRLFMDFASAYFVSIIAQEKSIGTQEYVSDNFLSVQDLQLRDAVTQFNTKMRHTSQQEKLTNYSAIREAFASLIQPWNSVGLLSNETRNRISHSAVAKWQQA